MFCFQCEQTAGGTGCSKRGVCGKEGSTSVLQDLVVHGLKGLSMYAHRARKFSGIDPEVDQFTAFALFTTLTNVNFDDARFQTFFAETARLRDSAKDLYGQA